MQIDEKARSRLYALTAIACAIWLIQSIIEASRDGSLLTWPTIIFSLCLAAVTTYCSICAWRGLSRSGDKEEDKDKDKEG